MDKTIFDSAISSEDMKKYISSKEMVWVQDQNGGSYVNQFILDTSVLANTQRWCDFSEAYLEIPYTITCKSSVDNAANVNAFALGLKNGTHQLIDSIQVDYNNTNVVQLQSNLNAFVNFKMMSSFSEDDLKKHGPKLIFSPDSAGSFVYNVNATPGRNGWGVCNNGVSSLAQTYALGQTAGNANSLQTYNTGFYNRLLETSYPALTAAYGYGALPILGTTAAASATKLNTMGKNYVSDNAGAAAARVWQWNILATIRLKDLSDFFAKLPIVRGAMLRFTVNYNAADMTITTAAAANPTMTITTLTMRAGRTCPIMISSAAASNPNVGLADGVLSISCGIGTGVANQLGVPFTQAVRLYTPTYILDPIAEAELLQVSQNKIIKYHDIQSNIISGVLTGANISSIITNGIINPKYIVVMPFLSAGTSNITSATGYPQMQSPFDSAPSTTCPLASLTNFNIQLSGKNVFQQNFQYDFEAFCNELQHINAINGGLTTGLTSGLISEFDFSNGYRYYVAALDRYPSSELNATKSVQLLGTNNTAMTLDYYVFIAYEREVHINLGNGQLVL
jgi:hypothetical protein